MVHGMSDNQSSAILEDVCLGFKYKVFVWSESPAGNSTRAVALRYLAPEMIPAPHSTSSTGNDLYFWLTAPVVLLLIVIIFKPWRSLRMPQMSPDTKLVQHHFHHHNNNNISTEPIPHPTSWTRKYGKLITSTNWKDEWEISPERLILGEVLGQGEFGVVVKGLLGDGPTEGASGQPAMEVAVKMLKANADAKTYDKFLKEINLMKDVGKHDHIVSFIGCCYKDELRLVVEYCALGDLQSYLREAYKYCRKLYAEKTAMKSATVGDAIENVSSSGRKYENCPMAGGGFASNQMYDVTLPATGDPKNGQVGSQSKSQRFLDSVDLLTYAYQIAVGMEYLSNNKVVHRDLATRNILLSSPHVVKISDFGLSEDIYEQNVFQNGEPSEKLPIRWLALESLVSNIYTNKSDVWSFGVVLWEIVTLGANPYPHIPLCRIVHYLSTGYRMERPASCNEQIYDTMLQCWQTNPKDRPSFSQLAARFQQFLLDATGSASDDNAAYLQLDQLLTCPDDEEIYTRDSRN
ncbi:hypothetical protein M8J77_022264 [Diaphorina citri]|nr:hypothetical protein M8J77_022264 [Diaphorina citri]